MFPKVRVWLLYFVPSEKLWLRLLMLLTPDSNLKILADFIKKLPGETKVVMEATETYSDGHEKWVDFVLVFPHYDYDLKVHYQGIFKEIQKVVY